MEPALNSIGTVMDVEVSSDFVVKWVASFTINGCGDDRDGPRA